MLEPLLTARRTGRPSMPASGRSQPSADRQSDASGQARIVLLADDDPIVRHVVRLLIELQGDTVLEAEDGPQAVARAADHAGRIDLLLTDVMMPGLSGPEVCHTIREHRPGLPTLFISGYFPEAVFPDRRLPPRTAFLSKPFMPEELAEALERLLADPTGLDSPTPPDRPSRESTLTVRFPSIRKVGSADRS